MRDTWHMTSGTWHMTSGGYTTRTRTAGLFDESPAHMGGDITGRCDLCALRISHTVDRHLLEIGDAS